jgi:hypothetical protein
MNRLVYLLILLLSSVPVNDAWAVAPDLPSAPLADDNDEYLPLRRQVRDERSSSGQGPMFVGLKSQTADFAVVRRGVPSKWNLTTPCTPPPLYVFMSLQI